MNENKVITRKQFERAIDSKLGEMSDRINKLSEILLGFVSAPPEVVESVRKQTVNDLSEIKAHPVQKTNWDKVTEYASSLGIEIQEKAGEAVGNAQGWLSKAWNWVKKQAKAFVDWLDDQFAKHPTAYYLAGCLVSGAVAIAYPLLVVKVATAALVTLLSLRYIVHAEELEDRRLAYKRAGNSADANENLIPSRVEIILKKTLGYFTMGISLAGFIGSALELLVTGISAAITWMSTGEFSSDQVFDQPAITVQA